MHGIGHKIEVPPHDNVKALSLLYDFLTKPETPSERHNCADLDPERYQENKHYTECRDRKDERGRGCKRCEAVGKRMPDSNLLNLGWNRVVY